MTDKTQTIDQFLPLFLRMEDSIANKIMSDIMSKYAPDLAHRIGTSSVAETDKIMSEYTDGAIKPGVTIHDAIYAVCVAIYKNRVTH
jgi:hypothetical protein